MAKFKSYTSVIDPVAKKAEEDQAKADDQRRKQETVNTNLRKQAVDEVSEAIRILRDIDKDYTVTAEEIAQMVDDRVSRMKVSAE